ncbi:hypothetical protein FQN54_003675 [Arachnomyces sp. PD_36]|nr:hypothetical protein FQN54_003675 [Arachnomyces sp. PD_36]
MSTPRVTHFEESMESLYGKLSISSPDQWDPPQKSGGHRGRYLWTDAFGVINLLTLHRESESSNGNGNGNGNGISTSGKYITLAKRLAHTVHEVLGRTRDGSQRLPGATDEEPLRGGLRIGKMEEGGPDGDGQYHHYLTLWMFALNRISMATGDPTYNRQAVSLAKAIHPHFFLDRETSRPHMVWKVAMDLSRPLVASEGNLDPIDGYVVFRLLQSYAMKKGGEKVPVLEEEIGDYKRVMGRKGAHYVSGDPLDLGMTLWTTHWLAGKESWATNLASRCVAQLRELFDDERHLEQALEYRLAFREFGTCLGIKCYYREGDSRTEAEELLARAEDIINAWEKYIEGKTPEDLRPITRVMYATALIPGAFKSGYFGPEPIVKV